MRTGIKNIENKSWFNLKVRIRVFLFLAVSFFSGKISLYKLYRTLRRLNYFLEKVQHNKFAVLPTGVKIDLYVPAFATKAFFTACRKFMVFNEDMPCTTVLISITSACRFSCPHCYQKLDTGKDVDIKILLKTVKKLQNNGIAFFNIEGGEPFLVFDRLNTICKAIDDRSEIWINSTGDGMTSDKLNELKQSNIAGIMFSMHSPVPDEFNRFMGKDNAWNLMIEGMKMCHDAGISVAINTCLAKKDFYDGGFEKLMITAKDLCVSIIQIIKPKPAGGYLSGIDDDFTAEDLELVKQKVNSYNNDFDKIEFPAISAQIIEESSEMFGCTAGGTDRFYINAKGDVQPCEFVNVSYGNIANDTFEDVYGKMRKSFSGGGNCWICEQYSCDVLKLYKEKNLKSLPLSKEDSEKLVSGWNRGEQSIFYKKVNNM